MYTTIIKTAIFAAILVAAAAMFGWVCGRVYQQYEAVFSPGTGLWNLITWILVTMALVLATSGLVAALIRPFWATVISFALSAVAMILAGGINSLSVILGLIFFVSSLIYARSVVRELNNRLFFSVRPIRESQKILLLALIVIVSLSFALGYRDDLKHRGTIVPPAYRETVMGLLLPRLQTLIKSQGEIPPKQMAFITEQFKQKIDEFWVKADTSLQPYAQYIPLGLALILIWALKSLLGLLSWIPISVLGLIFPLLRWTRVVRVETKTKEAERLTL